MFKLIKIENARMNVPEPVFHEAGEAITIGEALVLASGKLTKCGATTAPQFISMANAASGQKAAVCRVETNQVYEVPVSAAPTALKVGDKVTIDTDGLRVTSTTTNGVVTVESINGATVAGDTIVVRI